MSKLYKRSIAAKKGRRTALISDGDRRGNQGLKRFEKEGKEKKRVPKSSSLVLNTFIAWDSNKGSCSFLQVEQAETHVGLSLQKLEDKESALVSDKERVQWEGLDKEVQNMVLQFGGNCN